MLPEFTFHMNKKTSNDANTRKANQYLAVRFFYSIFLSPLTFSQVISVTVFSCHPSPAGLLFSFQPVHVGQFFQGFIVCGEHGMNVLDHGSKPCGFLEKILARTPHISLFDGFEIPQELTL